MKTRSFALPLVGCIVLFLISACSFAFLPPAKNQATIALQFSSITPNRSISGERAIVQGGGNLYIRTLGGPSGATGLSFGPYKITPGKVFETTDIPAGTYSKGIAVIYSADVFTDFSKTQNLSDDEFLKSSREYFVSISGSSSFAITEPVTIIQGVVNYLSLTMMPIVGNEDCVTLGNAPNYSIISPSSNTVARKFIMLSSGSTGVTPPGTKAGLICTVSGSGSVSMMALFNGNGKLVSTFTETAEPKKWTTPYTPGSLYYVYIECTGLETVLSFSDNAALVPQYAIGDIGPSGVGKVFYVTNGGSHGMEAAPESWYDGNADPDLEWKHIVAPDTSGTDGTDGTAIGTGAANTQAMIVAGIALHPAAAACVDYTGGGKTDWFLPSKDELNQMYENKASIGGFVDFEYLSSSQIYDQIESLYCAHNQDFEFGTQGYLSTLEPLSVRPVRAF